MKFLSRIPLSKGELTTLLAVCLVHAVLVFVLLFNLQPPIEPISEVEVLQAELITPPTPIPPAPKPIPKKPPPQPPQPPPTTPKALSIAPEKAKPTSPSPSESKPEIVQKKSVNEPSTETLNSSAEAKNPSPIVKPSTTSGTTDLGVEGGSIKLNQLKIVYKPDTNVFYPRISKDLGEQGVVGVLMFIDENGSVIRTQIITSSGFARLDKAAEQLCSRIRFMPYLVDGVPSRVSAGISIRFEMNR